MQKNIFFLTFLTFFHHKHKYANLQKEMHLCFQPVGPEFVEYCDNIGIMTGAPELCQGSLAWHIYSFATFVPQTRKIMSVMPF
jgi:hypothetical protein